MKKIFFILIAGVLPLVASAQLAPGETQYKVSLHAGYGHNLTYGSYANFRPKRVSTYLFIYRYARNRYTKDDTIGDKERTIQIIHLSDFCGRYSICAIWNGGGIRR